MALLAMRYRIGTAPCVAVKRHTAPRPVLIASAVKRPTAFASLAEPEDEDGKASGRRDQGSLTPEQKQWLLSEASSLINPETGLMPYGGWAQVATDFVSRFKVQRNPRALKYHYNIATHPSDNREFTETEVNAILRGVNSVLTSEGKPLISSLTMPSLRDFMKGRLMPDGSAYVLGKKDKRLLLADCATILASLGVDISSEEPAAAVKTAPQNGAPTRSEVVAPRTQVTRSFLTPEELQWLIHTVDKLVDPRFNEVMRGSWPPVHEQFCNRFAVKSLEALQMAYCRAKGRDVRAGERAAASKNKDLKREQLQWLEEAMRARYNPLLKRLRDGGWEEITDEFNRKYSVDKKLGTLKKLYSENRKLMNQPDVRRGSLSGEELLWLLETASKRIGPTGAMPLGGWTQVAEEFQRHFGFTKTAKSLKDQYYKARK